MWIWRFFLSKKIGNYLVQEWCFTISWEWKNFRTKYRENVHSVEISWFYYHSDFTWNQFWRTYRVFHFCFLTLWELMTQKLSLSDPLLVKPKWVWEVAVFILFFENCEQKAEKCKQIFENWNKIPTLKHVLALLK